VHKRIQVKSGFLVTQKTARNTYRMVKAAGSSVAPGSAKQPGVGLSRQQQSKH